MPTICSTALDFIECAEAGKQVNQRALFPMNSPPIKLIRVERKHRLAFKRGASQLQAVLDVLIPEDWPQFPEAFDVREEVPEETDLWPSYFFVCPLMGAVVGNGGFAGPPNDEGEVEIGYEVAPVHRGKGFATAAATLLTVFAFTREEVSAVVAHTLAEENSSTAVLRRIGMSMVVELPNPEVGKVWKWSVQRRS